MESLPKWHLDSGMWIHDEKKRRFIHEQDGKETDIEVRWHPETDSGCGKVFPPEFRYCPFCREELSWKESSKTEVRTPGGVDKAIEKVPVEKSLFIRSGEWTPPFGHGVGLRLVGKSIDISYLDEVAKRERPIASETDVFALPKGAGDFVFLVATIPFQCEKMIETLGSTEALVAFDRNAGDLYCHGPRNEKKGWISFRSPKDYKIGENNLPAWSWSAALSADQTVPGFAIPTSDGPVWIGFDWNRGRIVPVAGRECCIGGAARWKTDIFIPTASDGGVSIQKFDFEKKQWAAIGNPVSQALHPVHEAGEKQIFSVPVVEDRNILHWIGVHGLLSFDPRSGHLSWRPWKTGHASCRAIPEFGPPYRDIEGNFWQICYDDQDEVFRYYRLNGDEGDWQDVDGGRFSSGLSCFSRYYDYWKTPWAKIDIQREEKAESFRAPLLCLDEQSLYTVTAVFGKDSTKPILKIVNDRETEFPVALRIERPEAPCIEFDTDGVLNFSTPWDFRLFVYGGFLYAYLNAKDGCRKWRLQ